MSDLDTLKQSGDPLEKAIIRLAGEDLQPVLDPYAQIWAKYVVPIREGTGEFVKEIASDFAASHYTALVRLYNAWDFRQSISRLCLECGPGDHGDVLLNLQASTAAFWWSLGAAADNLGKALEDFPGARLKDRDAGVNLLSGHVPFIRFVYNRRTQLIHSRIVPIGMAGGYPVSDKQYLDGPIRTVLPAETKWQRDFNSASDLDQHYDGWWKEAVAAFASAWWKAKTFLNGVKPPRRGELPPDKERQVKGFFDDAQRPTIFVTNVNARSGVSIPDGPGPSGIAPS